MMDRRKTNKYQYYIQSQLPSLKRAIAIPPSSHEVAALQNRACSSLCELSANICLQEQSYRLNQDSPIKQKQLLYSPWNVQKKTTVSEDKELLIKKRKKNKKYVNSEYWNEQYRCAIEDKENTAMSKKHTLNELNQQKGNSVCFRIVGLNQDKDNLNLKSQHPDIEMVACLNRKKYSLVENRKCPTEGSKYDKSEVGVQLNRLATPQLASIQQKKTQGPKVSKKLERNLLCNWSQDVRDGNSHGDFWKGKYKGFKNNKIINKLPGKDLKNLEAKEVRETCLKIKRGSFSHQKPRRRDEYHSNNPLTRLLYEKYLSTIGVKQPSKERLRKFL